MREHESYRDNLERLSAYFGKDHNLVKASDVARYCGCCARTAAKIYDIPKHGITLPTLARRMCR